MLSYRHAFHAGNHADVLKHLVLVQVLCHYNLKDKPWWFIDTHAGAGIYRLDSVHAKKNAEYDTGIARLWQHKDLPPPVADYVAQVRALNPEGRLRLYPGSPQIALQCARTSDRLRLFELHGSDVKLLEQQYSSNKRSVAIRQADGFAEIKSVLPPPPRRGVILIDPSYEDKRDYLRVIATVKEGLSRFADGCFIVWYPCLQRGDARQLPEKLCKLGKDSLRIELTVHAPRADGFGMHGSGLVVINPPWTLEKTLQPVLPVLSQWLAQDENAGYQLTLV